MDLTTRPTMSRSTMSRLTMSILLPKIHSSVSVITNSSSELFVCETKKDIETIKGILQVLLAQFNQNLPEYYSGLKRFEDVFGKICSITEDPTDKKEFRKFSDPRTFINIHVDDFIEHYVIAWEAAEEILGIQNCPENLTDFYILKDGRKISRSNQPDDLHPNEVDFSETYKRQDAIRKSWVTERLTPELRTSLIGRVLIFSKDDNSIPYELFDEIRTVLNAASVHLG